MVDYPETVIYTEKDRVWCMGEDLDHPKKYITVCQRKALQGVIIVI